MDFGWVWDVTKPWSVEFTHGFFVGALLVLLITKIDQWITSYRAFSNACDAHDQAIRLSQAAD